MGRVTQLLKVLPRLGFGNAAEVARHRARSRRGYFRRVTFLEPRPGGRFFEYPPRGEATSDLTASLFGWREEPAGSPPDWHKDPFSDRCLPPGSHWSELLEQLPPDTDLKRYWEWSRFHWVPQFAWQATAGHREAGQRLEQWLGDWAERNPPYFGVNWTCGHEAAIRVLHLGQAASILNQDDAPLPALAWLLRMHLMRIEPTIGYGLAQQNNHGTTEAAAMMVAASWLRETRLFEKARRLFETHVLERFQEDGTSNQYSVSYHRSVLEVCSFLQLWLDRRGLPRLDAHVRQRVAAATEALRQLVDQKTGGVPNLGANDGSRILSLPGEDVPDYRPALELASALFRSERPFGTVTSKRLQAYGLAAPERLAPPPRSVTYDRGGLHLLRLGNSLAVMRYPRFRYRPAQADALHVDLWVDGENILRDAGTYVYAEPSSESFAFSATAAHNTIEFDGRDQMPRIGKFLFGDWLEASGVERVAEWAGSVEAAAGYTDGFGASHHRKIELATGRLTCTDRIRGARTAVLRWRLRPGEWQIDGNEATDGNVRLRVSAATTEVKLAIVDGWESLLYLQKCPIPVLEVRLRSATDVTTIVEFSQAVQQGTSQA